MRLGIYFAVAGVMGERFSQQREFLNRGTPLETSVDKGGPEPTTATKKRFNRQHGKLYTRPRILAEPRLRDTPKGS